MNHFKNVYEYRLKAFLNIISLHIIIYRIFFQRLLRDILVKTSLPNVILQVKYKNRMFKIPHFISSKFILGKVFC